MNEETEIYVGSGNVFADLGLPNPEERQLKARLIMEIDEAVKRERLTKKQAAEKLGMDQKKLSELLKGALSKHSVDELVQYLRCLGQEVKLSVSVRERQPEGEKRLNGARPLKEALQREETPTAVAA